MAEPAQMVITQDENYFYLLNDTNQMDVAYLYHVVLAVKIP